jgi:tetratricopeptide (TPR) repeat protein
MAIAVNPVGSNTIVGNANLPSSNFVSAETQRYELERILSEEEIQLAKPEIKNKTNTLESIFQTSSKIFQKLTESLVENGANGTPNIQTALINEHLGLCLYIQAKALLLLNKEAFGKQVDTLFSKAVEYYQKAISQRQALNEYFTNENEIARLEDRLGTIYLAIGSTKQDSASLQTALSYFQKSLKSVHQFSEGLINRSIVFTRTFSIWELAIDGLFSLAVARSSLFKNRLEKIPKYIQGSLKIGLSFLGALGLNKLILGAIYLSISKVASFGVVDSKPDLMSKPNNQSNILENIIDSLLPIFITPKDWADYLLQHATACFHAAEVYRSVNNIPKVNSNIERAVSQFKKVIDLAERSSNDIDKALLEKALNYMQRCKKEFVGDG